MRGAWLFNLRNQLLANPKFRAFAEKIPVLQWVARRRAYDLFAMAGGFIHSQVLQSCVSLGLFDHLKAGPRSAKALAEFAGLPEDRLIHLLRAAAALRLLEQRPDARFGLGVLGAATIDNPSILSIIRHHETLYRDLGEPAELFRGNAAGEGMQSLWPYATSDAPASLPADAVSTYTDLMAASQAMVAEQVIAAFSFRNRRRLLDIGGGSGAFVRAVHARWPHLSLTIADLPGVAEIAKKDIAGLGLSEAIDVVGADAARDELPTGYDVVSLVRILHDHDDPMAEMFVRAARRSLTDDGVLLIAEPMADAPGAGRLIDAYFNVYLLAMGSGRPRRFDELRDMLTAAGFGQVRRLRTRIPLITSVVVASP